MAVSVGSVEDETLPVAEEALPVAVWVALDVTVVVSEEVVAPMEAEARLIGLCAVLSEAETLPTAMRPAAMDVSVRSAR